MSRALTVAATQMASSPDRTRPTLNLVSVTL